MRNVPKIVVKRMAGAHALNSHPDADQLTAFSEQSLPPLERKQLLQHLEICSGCRDVLALALPETEVLPAAMLPARSSWGWWSRPALRFGLVAAGVLAVASVGFLQYRQHEPRDAVQVAKVDRKDSVRQDKKEASAQTAVAAPAASRETSALSSEPPAARPELRARKHALPALSLGGNRAVASAPRGGIGSASGARQGLAVPQPAPSSVSNEASSETVEVAAQSQPQDRLVQRQQASNNSLTNADVVKAKAAPPAQAATGAAPAFAPPNVTSLQTAPSLMSYAFPLWTVSSAGTLQRSFDAGKTWQEVDPIAAGLPSGEASKKLNAAGNEKSLKQDAPKLMFHAVAAIGPEVWAGSSGATLYHSRDSGSRWQQVLFPADASPTGDIVTIQFSDPQHGTLATSTSEVWTTADNGRTWQKQQ